MEHILSSYLYTKKDALWFLRALAEKFDNEDRLLEKSHLRLVTIDDATIKNIHRAAIILED